MHSAVRHDLGVSQKTRLNPTIAKRMRVRSPPDWTDFRLLTCVSCIWMVAQRGPYKNAVATVFLVFENGGVNSIGLTMATAPPNAAEVCFITFDFPNFERKREDERERGHV